MTGERAVAGRFKVSLEDLEAVHVAPEDMVEEQPEPPNPLDDKRWREQQETLRYASG